MTEDHFKQAPPVRVARQRNRCRLVGRREPAGVLAPLAQAILGPLGIAWPRQASV